MSPSPNQRFYGIARARILSYLYIFVPAWYIGGQIDRWLFSELFPTKINSEVATRLTFETRISIVIVMIRYDPRSPWFSDIFSSRLILSLEVEKEWPGSLGNYIFEI